MECRSIPLFYCHENGLLEKKRKFADGLYAGEWFFYNGAFAGKDYRMGCGCFTSGRRDLIRKVRKKVYGGFTGRTVCWNMKAEGHYETGEKVGEWFFVYRKGKRKLAVFQEN